MAHQSHDDLLQIVSHAGVRPGQHYVHYKTHSVYAIDSLALLESTQQLAVVYYAVEQPELKWIRVHDDFVATVGDQPRFSLLS